MDNEYSSCEIPKLDIWGRPDNPGENMDTDFRAIHLAPVRAVSAHLLCFCAQMKYFVTSIFILWKDIDEQTCSLYEIGRFIMSVTYK